jgi:hypothetical protein
MFKTHYHYKAYVGNYKHFKQLYFLHIMPLHLLTCIQYNYERNMIKNFVLEGNML